MDLVLRLPCIFSFSSFSSDGFLPFVNEMMLLLLLLRLCFFSFQYHVTFLYIHIFPLYVPQIRIACCFSYRRCVLSVRCVPVLSLILSSSQRPLLILFVFRYSLAISHSVSNAQQFFNPSHICNNNSRACNLNDSSIVDTRFLFILDWLVEPLLLFIIIIIGTYSTLRCSIGKVLFVTPAPALTRVSIVAVIVYLIIDLYSLFSFHSIILSANRTKVK